MIKVNLISYFYNQIWFGHYWMPPVREFRPNMGIMDFNGHWHRNKQLKWWECKSRQRKHMDWND